MVAERDGNTFNKFQHQDEKMETVLKGPCLYSIAH